MGYDAQHVNERYNPWTIVNLVFSHLAEEGLHPVLGDTGNPGEPAAALLVAMGIEPDGAACEKATQRVQDQLSELRAAVFEASDPGSDGGRGDQ